MEFSLNNFSVGCQNYLNDFGDTCSKLENFQHQPIMTTTIAAIKFISYITLVCPLIAFVTTTLVGRVKVKDPDATDHKTTSAAADTIVSYIERNQKTAIQRGVIDNVAFEEIYKGLLGGPLMAPKYKDPLVTIKLSHSQLPTDRDSDQQEFATFTCKVSEGAQKIREAVAAQDNFQDRTIIYINLVAKVAQRTN
jgi:hypothetical protein